MAILVVMALTQNKKKIFLYLMATSPDQKGNVKVGITTSRPYSSLWRWCPWRFHSILSTENFFYWHRPSSVFFLFNGFQISQRNRENLTFLYFFCLYTFYRLESHFLYFLFYCVLTKKSLYSWKIVRFTRPRENFFHNES